jgi:hypothetical protein
MYVRWLSSLLDAEKVKCKLLNDIFALIFCVEKPCLDIQTHYLYVYGIVHSFLASFAIFRATNYADENREAN